MTNASGMGRPGSGNPIAGALMATVGAIRAAASRRSLETDPSWQAVEAVLSEWESAGLGEHPGGRRQASSDDDGDPDSSAVLDDPLNRLAAVFRLDPVAADLLLVIAAPDIDPNIAAAYGLLTGAAAPRPATVALALELAGVSTVSAVGRAALGAGRSAAALGPGDRRRGTVVPRAGR